MPSRDITKRITDRPVFRCRSGRRGPKTITEKITKRLVKNLLSAKVVDNTIRGLWCEFMIAEAIGPTCNAVGIGWNAWDLQIGQDTANFPKRIRIQVKNSARLQVWHEETNKISNCAFNLFYRRRPDYLKPEIPCEREGFLCDLFILCYHEEEKWDRADQLDPAQWLFYLVPAVGPNAAITEAEKTWAAEKFVRSGKPVACIRRPETLTREIRQRPAIQPLRFRQLSLASIHEALGLPTD